MLNIKYPGRIKKVTFNIYIEFVSQIAVSFTYLEELRTLLSPDIEPKYKLLLHFA